MILALASLVIVLGTGATIWGSYLKTIQSDLNATVALDEGRLIFLGDIMLARDVERRGYANAQGVDYHFSVLSEIARPKDVLVANFESAVPTVHSPTPNYVMSFSTPVDSLKALERAGMSAVSLANNHTFDKGVDGYIATTAAFSDTNMIAFGHPEQLSDESVYYTNINDARVAIIAAHTVWQGYSEETWKKVISETKTKSDLQVVFIHWGEEYFITHNLSQEKLAKFLVAEGIDAIVGHHPHVVQDVAMIDGVPVFYSLGNFIFDQYFSDDVQQGLALAMKIHNGQIFEIELVPFSSLGSPTQPRLMSDKARTLFLSTLAERSQVDLAAGIRQGIIKLNEEILE